MPVPTLVLHIGTAKTGSTALQSALFRHRADLLAAGIAYVHGHGFENSRDLAAGCVGSDGDDDLLDDLGLGTAEARREFLDTVAARLYTDVAALPGDIHTVVLSSEHFHSRLVTPSMVARLADVVRPLAESVEVVCYLRPQADLIASFYSTYLRNGGCETFDEVADRVLRVGHPYADYDALLSLWADAFGADAVRPRVFGEFVGGSLLSDVAAVLGAPDGLLQAAERENPSISRVGQTLLLAINRALAAGAPPERLVEARNRIAATFTGPGERWPPDAAVTRQAAFAAGNESVRRRWFPDRPALFPPPRPEPPPEPTRPEQVDVLVDVLARLAADRDEPRATRWRRRPRS